MLSIPHPSNLVSEMVTVLLGFHLYTLKGFADAITTVVIKEASTSRSI
jgi:hypothetical protein